jgi:hypothetical protein
MRHDGGKKIMKLNAKLKSACEKRSEGKLGEKGVPGCTKRMGRRNMGKEKG